MELGNLEASLLAAEEKAALENPSLPFEEKPKPLAKTADGKATEEKPLPPGQLIPATEAYLTTDIVRAIVLEGTGRRAQRLGRHIGGKTGTTNQQADAWFVGFSAGRLVALALGSYLDTEVAGVDLQSWAAYGELDYLFFGWLNGKLAFDYIDPDVDTSDDARNRFSIGVEPFLDEYLQLRVFYRVLNGPEDQPNANRDELTLEGHLFFGPQRR